MGSVEVLTKDRMLQIEDGSVVSGAVDAFGRLILTTRGGDTIDAGEVRGPKGDSPTYDVGPFTGGTRYYTRLAVIDGRSLYSGSHLQFLISGLGGYGTIRRATVLVHVSQRGSYQLSVRAWSWGLNEATDPITLYYKQLGEFNYEIWAYMPSYTMRARMTVLSDSNSPTQVSIGDQTTTAPSGIVAIRIEEGIVALGNAVNLNTLILTGQYHQNMNTQAAAGTNYPTPLAGMLDVKAMDVMIYHRYTVYDGFRGSYEREFFNGVWSPWRSVAVDVPGSVEMYAGNAGTIPFGWLLCNGQAVGRTSYALLFSIIGTIYGAGDGSTTFNLPNIKGRSVVGHDSAQTEFDNVGELGGVKTHTLTIAEMPGHTHTQNAHSHEQSVLAGVGSNMSGRRDWQADGPGNIYPQSGVNTAGAIATNNNTGGGGAHNNMSPYIVMNFIIKF